MDWNDSQSGNPEIRMVLTRWIRSKGLCGIVGHVAVNMFQGQRWRATIYSALNGISAEQVFYESLTDSIDIKTPNFIEKSPPLQHHSVAKSQILEEVKVTFRISSSPKPQCPGSRSAFQVLAKQYRIQEITMITES